MAHRRCRKPSDDDGFTYLHPVYPSRWHNRCSSRWGYCCRNYPTSANYLSAWRDAAHADTGQRLYAWRDTAHADTYDSSADNIGADRTITAYRVCHHNWSLSRRRWLALYSEWNGQLQPLGHIMDLG